MGTRLSDGQTSWSSGVNSDVPPTIATPSNPDGLKRNQLAWLINGTVRGGGITQRYGWQPVQGIADGTALFQGAFTYNPIDGTDPYAIVSIGGIIWKVPFDGTGPTNLTALFPGTSNPPTVDYAYFCQGERFLVIQAGDGVTLPLFWDGATLRRSNGLTGVTSRGNNSVPISYNVVSTASFINPAINLTATMHTPGAAVSHLNQRIAVTDLALTPIDTFLITSVNTGAHTEVWKNLTGANPGTYPAQTFIATLSSATTFSGTPAHSFVIPNAVGGTFTMSMSGYVGVGNIGDTVDISNATPTVLGTFTVTAFTSTTITFQVVSSAFLGVGIPIEALTFAITSPATIVPVTNINELPAAFAMDYYQGRIWYAQGNIYSAGDIVGGPSGTQPYNFTDSILCVTENPLAIGGDGFAVPADAGQIRALVHSANLDATLGQGRLYIGTRKQIFALSVPISRDDWINAGTNNQPVQTVVQINNGMVNDRSVTAVNGDLFFQSLEPSVRSLITAIRYFQQWANPPISREEQRILSGVDRSLMRFSSGISFDNRLLQATYPKQTSSGVVHQAVLPMDFDPLNSLQGVSPPAWEGHYQGLLAYQLLTADIGGVERAFAIMQSQTDGGIELWEMVNGARFENGDNRIVWQIEFPAYNFADEFKLKQLDGCEVWLDRLFGSVEFTLEYRPDGYPCWLPWLQWKDCSARDSCEDVLNPQCSYPVNYRESFKAMKAMPRPPVVCVDPSMRPSDIGYQFQVRLTIKGFCRIRGLVLYANPYMKAPFEGITC